MASNNNKTVTSPNVLTPEVVPGGYLDGARWNKVQEFMDHTAEAVNQVVIITNTLPGPTPWPGLARIIITGGGYNLAPDENFVIVNLASSAMPPPLPALADLSFVLPLRVNALGPIHIFTGNGTFARVTPTAGDRIVFPDIEGGTGPTVDVFVNIGDNATKLMSSFVPVKESTTDWAFGEATVRK